MSGGPPPRGRTVIGHFGDRIGRKSMLVLTLTLMGVATFLIGLVPGYDQIGFWAALILITLRMVQGFGVGGEWGGAVLMAIEHAPPGQRGFYGSWPQIGVPAGLILSTGVFAIVSRLPLDQFLSWGWRIPFLLSILLVAVGLFIRLKVLERFSSRPGRGSPRTSLPHRYAARARFRCTGLCRIASAGGPCISSARP